MDRLRVKICGVTRIEDAEACVLAGADMIGLNFVKGSPRFVEDDHARALASVVRGRAKTVGVFVNESETRIREIITSVGLDHVQLHGDESPGFVLSLAPFAFKAMLLGSADDAALASLFPGDPLLVDARVPGQRGGTGVRVDLSLVEPLCRVRRVIVAGGLAPANIASVVRACRPWGVDVASGVEASPGVKDSAMIRSFVEEARRAAEDVAGEKRAS